LDDLKNVGESNYNPGVGTDQRVQSLVFMMMMLWSWFWYCLVLVTWDLEDIKGHRQNWVGILLARAYDSATTICAKAFITSMRVTVQAPNLLAADEFGLVFFTYVLVLRIFHSVHYQ